MSIYRVGYREDDCQATLYNHGCNWNCGICSYKLREGFAPSRTLSTKEVLSELTSFHIDKLLILGGEPMTCPDLDVIVAKVKERRAIIRIAHSNASILPPQGVDEIGISLRAFSRRKHQQLTGTTNTKVLGNIYAIHDRGLRMEVSTILIPQIVGADEIAKVAAFLADVDPAIPFHISSYLPVPGISWRRPTREEMAEAVLVAREHLKTVSWSSLSVNDYLASSSRDTMQHRDGVF
ncbi:MAG: radical SAM protein [Methanomassiliicoccales archaeon]|nr:radical SAM protein [Methanomassiliicoccales archaeon]